MRNPPFDSSTAALLEQLLDTTQAGRDPTQREYLGDLIRGVLQLGCDGADTGEIKLMTRSFRELRHALNVFRPHRSRRKISVFGSARTPPGHPDYACARDFCRTLAGRGWMTITGAGPGIMAAGNEGAGPGNSFGLSIKLPWETNGNQFLRGDPKLVYFRYFFTRKLLFALGADAMAVFPGGFGTMDECFELLTLMQTGKSALIPIVLLAPPGNTYWKDFLSWLEQHFVANGWIDEKDLFLFKIFDNPEAAADHVEQFYRLYHSTRFVGDHLVIRIRRPLTGPELAEINTLFQGICVEGAITQDGPLPGEGDEWPEMTRLVLRFNRKNFSILRMLIDQVNAFA
ncbi:MAG TPA: LOG family protein [Fibrobacteria bacterium]|nr:LOG family protein [Fibrobacteria bacterium]